MTEEARAETQNPISNLRLTVDGVESCGEDFFSTQGFSGVFGCPLCRRLCHIDDDNPHESPILHVHGLSSSDFCDVG